MLKGKAQGEAHGDTSTLAAPLPPAHRLALSATPISLVAAFPIHNFEYPWNKKRAQDVSVTVLSLSI